MPSNPPPDVEELDPLHARFLDWRGVDVMCGKCRGTGTYMYSNTSTWRRGGGFYGQMMTTDVCDACWGTGDQHRHGMDLRAARERVVELERELAEYRDERNTLRAELIRTIDDLNAARAALEPGGKAGG